MAKYIAQRLLSMIPVLLIASFIVYMLLYLSPGDPVLMLIPLDTASDITDEELDHYRAELGLDRPVVIQYLNWLSDAAQGDLGRSIHLRRPVREMIADTFPVTLELALLSMAFALIVAVPVGIYSAIRPNSIGDFIGSIMAMVGISAPNFWVAILLIWGLSVHFDLLPAGGYVRWGKNRLENLERMVLPSITLGTALMASVMRMTRSSMLEVLHNDYIRTARGKGLRERHVIMVHALKNALIPVMTIIGLQMGLILGGAVVIEQIFSLPGMGRMLLDAVLSRDFPVTQAGVLVTTLVVLIINLCVDLLYAYLDPRIRYA